MKLHYHKQRWIGSRRKRQIFSLFLPVGGGVGLVIFGHEIALIKREAE